ncbi:MAG TPA: trehalose-phosphatase [Aliidongia sp.]|nr:trehalose-phosphatase [Aliidongia sp.]
MLEQYPAIGRNTALFLDIDGTLVGFAEDPDKVDFPDSLRMLLAGFVEELDGAVALISGRALESVDRLAAPLRLPAAGQHGAEWRPTADAATIRVPAPDLPPAARLRLSGLVEGRDDLRLEDKGLSVALHYQPTTADVSSLALLMADLGGRDFELLKGRLVLELRPRGLHKGEAVARFLAMPPFQGRIPFFLGDDRTDEDGFATVRRHGGHAIRVGGSHVSSLAEYFLAGPEATRQWLGQSLDHLRAIKLSHQ